MIISHLRAWDSCGPVGQVTRLAVVLLQSNRLCDQDLTVTTMAFDASEISTLNIRDIVTTCPGGNWWFASSVTAQRMNFADLNGNCSWFSGYTFKSDYPRQYLYSQGE